MMISIGKLKKVIDELQDAELSYKRQILAFNNVLHEYKALDKDGNDKKALRLVEEELQKEYQQIKKLKITLNDIVKCYETAEKNVLSSGSGAFGGSSNLKKVDIDNVRKILNDYNITLL